MKYKLLVVFDEDLKDYMKDVEWEVRKTKTQYINDLVRADMLSRKGNTEIREIVKSCNDFTELLKSGGDKETLKEEVVKPFINYLNEKL